MDIFDTIYAAKDNFVRHYMRKPSRIYLGYEELNRIKAHPMVASFYYLSTSNQPRDQVIGLDVYKVAENNHLFVA